MSRATKTTFRVTRRAGAVVVQSGLKVVQVYEREEILNMILPGGVPAAGSTTTFEIRKVGEPHA